MQPKDLYSIIIKVFGLFLFKDILFSIPYIITPLIFLLDTNSETQGIASLIFSLAILSIYILVAYIFNFKSESVLKLLKLDDDFLTENMSLDISSKNVVTISLILLGGYILIDEIPNFLSGILKYYQETQIKFAAQKPSVSTLVTSGIKIIIALLILGERKRIIEAIIKKPKSNHTE